MADFIKRPDNMRVWESIERLNRESEDFKLIKEYLQELYEKLNEASLIDAAEVIRGRRQMLHDLINIFEESLDVVKKIIRV